MATDPTTNTLRQAAEAAAGEIETWLLRSNPDGWRAGTFRDIILRHFAPAFERVQAQAAGMREVLKALVIEAEWMTGQLELVEALPADRGERISAILSAAEIDLASDAGSALLERLAAAEKVAIAAQGYYLTTSDDGVMANALREAIAAYRKLCPTEVK